MHADSAVLFGRVSAARCWQLSARGQDLHLTRPHALPACIRVPHHLMASHSHHTLHRTLCCPRIVNCPGHYWARASRLVPHWDHHLAWVGHPDPPNCLQGLSDQTDRHQSNHPAPAQQIFVTAWACYTVGTSGLKQCARLCHICSTSSLTCHPSHL